MTVGDDDEVEEVTGQFGSGRSFRVTSSRMGERYFVEDESGDVVAVLPGGEMGEVVTGAGRWRFSIDRRKRGWMVAARRHANAKPVGWAYPSLLPAAYVVVLARETSKYRLRQNLLTGNWTLRRGRATVARLTTGLIFPRAFLKGGVFRSSSDIYPARIEVATGRISGEKLSLLIALALEAVKCESEIAHLPVPSGGW